jgi:hypothetical protein
MRRWDSCSVLLRYISTAGDRPRSSSPAEKLAHCSMVPGMTVGKKPAQGSLEPATQGQALPCCASKSAALAESVKADTAPVSSMGAYST